MQTENPIFADIAKLLNSAAGTMAGMGREARESARERIKEGLGGLDFVAREEFDAVKDMAAKAREENEKLADRVTVIEKALKANTKK
jgi:BMFP domain-containing protein YqiC